MSFFFSQHLILSRYSATTDACCQYNSGAFKSDAAVYTNVTTFLLCCLFLPPPAFETVLYANQTRANVPEIHKNGRNSTAAGISKSTTTTKIYKE